MGRAAKECEIRIYCESTSMTMFLTKLPVEGEYDRIGTLV